MLIIPAIDIKEGRCVRLTEGKFEDVEIFSVDPVAVAVKAFSTLFKFPIP